MYYLTRHPLQTSSKVQEKDTDIGYGYYKSLGVSGTGLPAYHWSIYFTLILNKTLIPFRIKKFVWRLMFSEPSRRVDFQYRDQ